MSRPPSPQRKLWKGLIREAAESEDTRFSTDFILAEWERVVDAWQLEPGKSTATSAAWAATVGCPKTNGRVFGLYLSGSGKDWEKQTL